MGNPTTYGLDRLWTESVSAVTLTPSVALGTIRKEDGRDYIYVYNGSASSEQILPKYAVRLNSGSTGYTVDCAIPAGVPATNTAAVGFGICVHSTITTGAYGWLCRRGFVEWMSFGAAAIAAGNHLHVFTSGTAKCVAGETVIGNIRSFVRQGYACEATNATAAFTAYVNFMGGY